MGTNSDATVFYIFSKQQLLLYNHKLKMSLSVSTHFYKLYYINTICIVFPKNQSYTIRFRKLLITSILNYTTNFEGLNQYFKFSSIKYSR